MSKGVLNDLAEKAKNIDFAMLSTDSQGRAIPAFPHLPT
jgi:hypothetical protein